VHPQTTNVTYKIDDGTAVTDVKKWVDAEKAEGSDPQFAPDTYVRVYGRITVFNGKKHVGAHFIRAIDDFNEVNYHLLEATYVHLSLTKGAAGQQGGNTAGNTGEDGMFVDNYGGDGGNTGVGGGGGGGSNARVAACSLRARTMYTFLQNTPGASEGINCNAIASGTNLSMRDVMAAADELLGQGLVYTTLDDETWAVLDY
jgi:replication factor A2